MRTRALAPYQSPGQFNIADLLPMPPDQGPPLPRFLQIFWPWLGSGQSFLPLDEEPALTTYDNTEEVELLDIDPDLLMPRKIIIHRKSKQLR